MQPELRPRKLGAQSLCKLTIAFGLHAWFAWAQFCLGGCNPRVDISRSSDAGGSGVGLTISRAIASSHCGTVNATSPGLNGEAPSGSPVRSPTTTHEPYLSRVCQQPRDFPMLPTDSDQTSHAGSVRFRRVSLAPRTLRLPREEGPGSGLPGFTRSSTLEPSSNPSSTTRGLRFDTRADVIV